MRGTVPITVTSWGSVVGTGCGARHKLDLKAERGFDALTNDKAALGRPCHCPARRTNIGPPFPKERCGLDRRPRIPPIHPPRRSGPLASPPTIDVPKTRGLFRVVILAMHTNFPRCCNLATSGTLLLLGLRGRDLCVRHSPVPLSLGPGLLALAGHAPLMQRIARGRRKKSSRRSGAIRRPLTQHLRSRPSTEIREIAAILQAIHASEDAVTAREKAGLPSCKHRASSLI